jgi:hypothetical protein
VNRLSHYPNGRVCAGFGRQHDETVPPSVSRRPKKAPSHEVAGRGGSAERARAGRPRRDIASQVGRMIVFQAMAPTDICCRSLAAFTPPRLLAPFAWTSVGAPVRGEHKGERFGKSRAIRQMWLAKVGGAPLDAAWLDRRAAMGQPANPCTEACHAIPPDARPVECCRAARCKGVRGLLTRARARREGRRSGAWLAGPCAAMGRSHRRDRAPARRNF